MGIPDWNKLEANTVSNTLIEANHNTDGYRQVRNLTEFEQRSVVINTVHDGTQRFREYGVTRFSVEEILDYAVEQGYIGATDRAAGNLPGDDRIREWGQEYFEESWEIDEYIDYESGDTLSYDDSFVEDTEIE